MDSNKLVHTLVLDTGAIIKNDPPASTLLQRAEKIVTIPSILSEIKDATTRNRFENTLRPFVTLINPEPASIKFVTDFARKTGDLAILSRPDIELIALTYQLECRQNGGDWRLRNSPGQKKLNGQPPKAGTRDASANTEGPQSNELPEAEPNVTDESVVEPQAPLPAIDELTRNAEPDLSPPDQATNDNGDGDDQATKSVDHDHEVTSDSDSDDWITLDNLKQKQEMDGGGSSKKSSKPQIMEVAIITSDYAMQNVILQINLNLLSPSMYRIQTLKTHVLRCHACFQVCKDLTKQFCPRCGQATLNRVSCSTNAHGEFKLHLKKNMQWNHRGDRYSVPKPVHGSSNGKLKGGGKGGWGNSLMLAEDQKEYQSATREQARRRERGLMDEDYLPGILTGDRGKQGGRITVGAGRNVNSKKR